MLKPSPRLTEAFTRQIGNEFAASLQYTAIANFYVAETLPELAKFFYAQSDEEWWQVAYNDGQGGFYVGTPELDESTQTIGFAVAVPIRDHDGGVSGVLRTTLDLVVLTEVMAEAQLGETGFTDLVLPDGTFVGEEGIEEGDPEALALVRAADPDTILAIDFEGIPSLISQAPVGGTASRFVRFS